MSHSTELVGLPIVIGSGLTGMSISYWLSRAGIDHLVIGRKPDGAPRLGASMNLEGTLLLWEMFPQLSRFFFPKKQVLGYRGDYEVVCDFDVAQRAVSRVVFRAVGYGPVDEFLQIASDSTPRSGISSSPASTVRC